MTDAPRNPFEKGQLRLEATEWFVLMRGPDAEQHRAAFEQWLARGALHRAAYNRVANLYAAGKQVDWDALPPPRPVRGALWRTKAAALAGLTIIGFLSWRLLSSPGMPMGHETQPAAIASSIPPVSAYLANAGEIRRVQLTDGSRLTLDEGALVLVDYQVHRRGLRLERGRARFEVAHEPRPFIVEAGGSEIIARGTVFDVALEKGRSLHVHLLHGAIDVRPLGASSDRDVVHMTAGEGLRYQDGSPAIPEPRPEPAPNWLSSRIEFRSASLASVVAAANSRSARKIILGDPSLGETRISGLFEIDDPESLASALAVLLDLKVASGPDTIVLVKKEK
ncbi:FecR family protein [Novosphingobium album (ex Liu et al. 2023)]|uniref:FecR domain-containing protein n=1 Tax=Novosphingobium album (ex Liu et al. 2023) TaxID=3031130 RepID=A0ABT5WQD1_9SPHN|nr:FecR domain-containing protein [Novosphingobium album (ex Liu et al. 2023)]MDE8652266.1 FecR domain-containing protein [Novosphingobium album (ex Liu et al. 2023)]